MARADTLVELRETAFSFELKEFRFPEGDKNLPESCGCSGLRVWDFSFKPIATSKV